MSSQKSSQTPVSILFRSTIGRSTGLICFLSAVSFAWTSTADDWPQFRGIQRDSKSAETGLLKSWPEAGPELVWSFKNAGIGYSSPAVAGDRVYLTGSREGKAELFCLNTKTGAELWALPINAKEFDFKGNSWGAGPRAAPTVDGNMVYAVSGDGVLLAADTDGNLKWKLDLVGKLGGSVNPIGGGPKTYGWGFCWGPLVDGDNLICTPGSTNGEGLVVALNKVTGKVVWRSAELSEEATYASPIVVSIEGVKQYVVMTQAGVAAVAPEDGKLLWYYKRSRPYSDVVIPTPVSFDNYVFASTGDGCDMFKVSKQDEKFELETVYTSRNMKNSIGGFVYHDGHIFGTSERRGWVCLDSMTGKIAWYERASKGIGEGSLIFADGRLYLYGEKTAQVSLIEASTEDWVELGNFALPETSKLTAPSGKTWTRPVIADGMLYIRDQDLLFCFRIK